MARLSTRVLHWKWLFVEGTVDEPEDFFRSACSHEGRNHGHTDFSDRLHPIALKSTRDMAAFLAAMYSGLDVSVGSMGQIVSQWSVAKDR